MNWLGKDSLSMLRSFWFDRQLALTDSMWIIGPLNERGVDPATADPDQLTVTYWNGTAWQPDVCSIPQGNDER